MKKTACLILSLLLIFPFSSCSKGEKRVSIACAIFSEPGSMDPSVAKDNEALLIIGNIFEGLVRLDSEGNIVQGIAKSWEISEDRMHFTFTLRDNLKWSDGTPLTSHDVRFGMLRTLMPETGSHMAGSLYCIKNAKSIHEGLKGPDSLGVTTPDDKTVIIELEYPEPDFLRALTLACAMPCNEEYFHSTKGRYGLEANTILSNGAYELTSWKHGSQITVKKNPNYHAIEDNAPHTVTIKILNDNLNAAQMLLSGNIHISLLDRSELAAVSKSKLNLISFDDATWTLLFNLKGKVTQNTDARAGLVKGIDRQSLHNSLPAYFTPATGIIPPASRLGDKSLRELHPSSNFPKHDPAAGKQSLSAGFAALGFEKQPKITLICPNDAEIRALADILLEQWRQNLNIYINLEPLNESDLANRVKSGNFEAALFPLTAKDDNSVSFLSPFASDSPGNPAGFQAPDFDALLSSLSHTTTYEERAKYISDAEQMLIDQFALLPLFYESRHFGTTKDIQSATCRPFKGFIDFSSIRTTP